MVCQASALGTGRTPINIPPSTTVQRHFLLHTHSLHVSLDTILPRFSRSPSAHYSSHIHPCAILHQIVHFLPLNMPKPYLNLALWILFSTHSMPKRLNSSSLRFLSFKDNPHIFRTIILSALPNPVFISHVSLPYTNTLWIQASYIFPFSFK